MATLKRQRRGSPPAATDYATAIEHLLKLPFNECREIPIGPVPLVLPRSVPPHRVDVDGTPLLELLEHLEDSPPLTSMARFKRHQKRNAVEDTHEELCAGDQTAVTGEVEDGDEEQAAGSGNRLAMAQGAVPLESRAEEVEDSEEDRERMTVTARCLRLWRLRSAIVHTYRSSPERLTSAKDDEAERAQLRHRAARLVSLATRALKKSPAAMEASLADYNGPAPYEPDPYSTAPGYPWEALEFLVDAAEAFVRAHDAHLTEVAAEELPPHVYTRVERHTKVARILNAHGYKARDAAMLVALDADAAERKHTMFSYFAQPKQAQDAWRKLLRTAGHTLASEKRSQTPDRGPGPAQPGLASAARRNESLCANVG